MPIELTRREMLSLALASPFFSAMPRLTQSARSSSLDVRSLMNAPSDIVPVGGSGSVSQVKLVRQWKGPFCRSHLTNRGRQSVRIKEVVLFDLKLTLPPTTTLYG